MRKLNKKYSYNWENIIVYYLKYPEYGEPGWFVEFRYAMSYKNQPMPIQTLPTELQAIILKNLVQIFLTKNES